MCTQDGPIRKDFGERKHITNFKSDGTSDIRIAVKVGVKVVHTSGITFLHKLLLGIYHYII